MTIEIFLDSGNRRIYPSSVYGRPILRFYQYHHEGHTYYDSILHTTTLSPTNPPANRTAPLKLRLGVWNLSGAASVTKRMVIDKIVHQQHADIVCIQESHLLAQSVESSHYYWRLGPQTPTRASRGCGFLFSKRLPHHTLLTIHSVNICQLDLTSAGGNLMFTIVCVHRQSEGSVRGPMEMGLLTSLMRSLMQKAEGSVILVGDLNSHLGLDLFHPGQQIIGQILHHPTSNTNGHSLYDMCAQLELRVLTTLSHTSTRCTWFRTSGSSQLDHVIQPAHAAYEVSLLRGCWTKYSDHKLITFNVWLPSQSE